MSIVEKALDKLQRQTARAGKLPDGTPDNPSVVARREHVRLAEPDVTLNFEALRARGMLPPEEHAARLTDEYRRIKRPLLASAFGKGVPRVNDGNLIMVASSVSGEGKTFTSLNLSLSIALERDCTVLLVDADVARPNLSEVLDIKQRPGLLDVITDDGLQLNEVLIKTDVPGFQLLSAGRRRDDSPELMASRRTAALMHELAGRYPDRIVVLDSPPLLATNEAAVLAQLAGQVVLVVRADVTPAPAVEEAVAMLDSTRPINLVLNQAQHLFGHDYYGAYY